MASTATDPKGCNKPTTNHSGQEVTLKMKFTNKQYLWHTDAPADNTVQKSPYFGTKFMTFKSQVHWTLVPLKRFHLCVMDTKCQVS